MRSILSAGIISLAVCAGRAPANEPTPPPAADAAGSMRIVVTIPPLVGLVRELAPSDATITGLMAPGQSEHGYEFKPSDLDAMARSQVAVYIGLGLEPTVQRFFTRQRTTRRQVVNLAQVLGLEKAGDVVKPHEEDHDHDHGHQPEADHEHAIDVHLWLDPELVLQTLPAIGDAIKKAGASRANADAFALEIDNRVVALRARIIKLDEQFKKQLEPFKGRAIVTHHAAFGRFAHHYGLEVAQVIRPFEGAEPTPEQINLVLETVKKQNVHTIFVEPQFDAKAARRIAEVARVRIETLDPLGDGDYFAMMEKNVAALVRGLGEAPGVPAK